jgi:hypothetical protein
MPCTTLSHCRADYSLRAWERFCSTSFANPAITIARSLTNTFSGIRPVDAPAFIAAQLIGALAAFGLGRLIFPAPKPIPVTPTAQSSPLPAEHAEAARV